MRRNGIDEAVRAHGIRPVGVDADSELDVGIADHQRLALDVAPAEKAQVEQGGGHHGCDDGAVEIAEGKPVQLQQRLQHNRPLVRRARRLGHRAPFAAQFAAVMHGKNDVGIPRVDG